jgi:hypothetical protein
MERKSTSHIIQKQYAGVEHRNLVFRNLMRKKILKPLLIAMEGTQTPAGNSGNAETPQEPALRRLSVAPRKAECLERKSTAPFNSQKPTPFSHYFFFKTHPLFMV